MSHLPGAVYTKLFDELAYFFERKYGAGIKTLEAKLALDARIDAEYKELFGKLRLYKPTKNIKSRY